MGETDTSQKASDGLPADRRQYERVETRGVQSLLGSVVDLSPHGMCVEHQGRTNFAVDDAFDVVVWQGNCELLVTVRVVWTEPMGSGGHRLGLEFVSEGPKLSQVVAELARRGCGQMVGPQCWLAA